MVTKVNKRKGYQEDFQVEKIKLSIEKAAQETGISDEEMLQIVEDISSYVLEKFNDFDVLETEDIRNTILSKLDETYPEIANSWRNYDKAFKGRNE